MLAKRLLVLLLLGLVACSGPNLAPNPPSGFDLNGEWVLVEDASGVEPAARRFTQNRTGARRRLARGGVARDFPVLGASSMRIEQSGDSMGIRYDGQLYRDISWGKRERGMWTVNAGWVDNTLHIISQAHDSEATEIMSLSADGRTLTVDVDVNAGQKFSVRRVFERL